MLPIFWRYLLREFFRVFCLTVCTFIGILIVSRFKEIARFAALSGSLPTVGFFTLYQIPFILPLAIPISSFLASFLLFQRLSGSQELPAMRASGIGIGTLIAPLLSVGCLLSILHFSICAEIAPYCGRKTKTLLYEKTSANPLLLLQRQSLVKLKHTFLKMKMDPDGKSAQDLLLAAYNPSNARLFLFSAEALSTVEDSLLGTNAAFLVHLMSKTKEGFDPLILENQQSMSTSATLLCTALKKHRPRIEHGGLSLKMLLLRASEKGKHRFGARIEILRRSVLSIAVFTLTLLGCAYGMQGGRIMSKKHLILPFFLVLFVVVAYLGVKELKTQFLTAWILAGLPQLLILFFSLKRLCLLNRGLNQ